MPTEMHKVGDIRPQRASPDAAIAEIAGRQYGVVTHRQLLDVELTRAAIQHRQRSGRLYRVHRGVYAVGHRRLPLRGHWLAAVLACGDRSALSHRAAGALLELLPYRGTRIDVTAPGARPRRAVAVHRVRHLPDDDRILVAGIPVTSVTRTLVDLAGVVRIDQLERAVETAERQGVFDLRALEHRGMPRALREVLRDLP